MTSSANTERVLALGAERAGGDGTVPSSQSIANHYPVYNWIGRLDEERGHRGPANLARASYRLALAARSSQLASEHYRLAQAARWNEQYVRWARIGSDDLMHLPDGHAAGSTMQWFERGGILSDLLESPTTQRPRPPTPATGVNIPSRIAELTALLLQPLPEQGKVLTPQRVRPAGVKRVGIFFLTATTLLAMSLRHPGSELLIDTWTSKVTVVEPH